MSLSRGFVIPLAAALALQAGAAVSQQSAPSAAPSSLVLYFEFGSAEVRPTDMALLDQASRLYRDGKPIVMVITGSTDAVGTAEGNRQLSQRVELWLRPCAITSDARPETYPAHSRPKDRSK